MNLKNNIILRSILVLSIILSIYVYFQFRTFSWPFGSEGTGCLISIFVISVLVFSLWKFKDRFTNPAQERNIGSGLITGLLWTIEIGINNFIRPGLLYRDTIDNLFWAVITLLILFFAAREAYRSKKFLDGLLSGFWTGLSSGAVACIAALLLIVFGMNSILLDPLNQKEWADVKASVNFPDISVYFGYQTFTGAIMHLFILGLFFGLILGSVGGLSGNILRIFKKSLNGQKIIG